jgi:flagellar hook-associated protein 3 FlgL
MQVDPNYVQTLVGSLNNTSASEELLSNELSSGLGITSLSSNPTAVAQSTQFSAAISQDDSYVQAATTAQSKLQVTDTALGEVVSQLTSAASLTLGGANGTNSAQDTSAIASQLTSIESQVLGLANTSFQGQFVFSGSQGSVQPFTQDTSTTPVTTTYNGDTAVQFATTPAGQKIQTNVPGSSIFTAAGGNVFAALSQTIADLTSGASSTTLAADAASITSALGTVTGQRSVIDNSLSQLESTSTFTQTNETVLEAAQSTLISANTATVATQLSSDETQTQALDSTISTLEQNSLFNYLPR